MYTTPKVTTQKPGRKSAQINAEKRAMRGNDVVL